ncbi:MFS family permease [Nitrobacteraceae bacterium AZCC 2161]
MILTLFRNVEFRSYMVANIVFRLCASGLTVLLGYQIYELTRSPFSLGLLGLVEAVPGVTLILYGGDFADRHSRYRIVVVTTGLLAILAAALAVISSDADVSVLVVIYVVAFVSASIRAFEAPAVVGLEAQILPLHQVLRGIPILASSGRMADVAGPVVAGSAWAAFGATMTYGGIAALFLFSWLWILFGVRNRPPLPRSDGVGTWQRIAEGVRYVFGSQILLGSMALDLFAVFFAGANALLPIFALEILHVGPEGFGLLRSASAAGALVAALAATRLLPVRHAGVALHVIIELFGLCVITFGLSTNFELSLAALFLAGLCDGTSIVIRHAILRLASPEALRGRIAAVKSVFTGSSNELGTFQSGMTASLLGAGATLCLGGAVTLGVVAVVAWRARMLLHLNLETLARPDQLGSEELELSADDPMLEIEGAGAG